MNVELKNVSKCYTKGKLALDDFSVTFSAGIYGMLGPNGAGKSTLINLITDNISRTSGEILYGGEDILKLGRTFRARLGYMPQQQGFYDDMSAYAFMMYMAQLKGLSKKDAKAQSRELLETVSLSSVAHNKIKSFSGGMKQRVLLAQALLGNPEILILDEPTSGLDPKERINIRNYIAQISKDKIILLATHVVSDIECIADKVLLIKSGRLIQYKTPAELTDSIENKVFERICEKDEIEKLQNEYAVNNVAYKNGRLTFRTVGDSLPQGFEYARDVNLEDVYLYYFNYCHKNTV
ncbi:MAG: ATP-binding cassette domain-containing protein [Clostridiales bacterium]|nr:ATP-binding cassette domain-containing protein [Clostridiales bacterium]